MGMMLDLSYRRRAMAGEGREASLTVAATRAKSLQLYKLLGELGVN